jgi:hypothetical protein
MRPKYSRKDYRALSEIIKDAIDSLPNPILKKKDHDRFSGMRIVVDSACGFFIADNKLFDPVKFKTACGVLAQKSS